MLIPKATQTDVRLLLAGSMLPSLVRDRSLIKDVPGKSVFAETSNTEPMEIMDAR
ncbi:hypothetical protein HDF16_005664 [Granulicella aggregans]|uniref:Uncharacterized protein n=1 Tax=Granulicella aggregans TaxID=474949 RepID=A0A7W7ZJL1_9BACT|nr:hypothetical protein [Granulicella aggregans]